MFSEDRKIRYSHLATNQSVHIAEILRFAQDSAVMHTASCGYSLNKLNDSNSAWILLSIHLILEQPITCSTVTVKTWPYDFSKVFGPRAFLISDAETDSVLSKCASLWTFVDTINGRPKEIPKEMIDSFGIEPQVFDVSYIRRIPQYELTHCFGSFTVLKRDLDTNGHMNNVRYLEYAMEVLPLGYVVNEVELFYKQPLYAGDNFLIYTGTDDEENIIVNLKRIDGQVCAYIKFISA